MGTVFLKQTRPLNSVKQVKAHAKYVGFRSNEITEKGFFGRDVDKADYEQFIKRIEDNPALKHAQSIKAQKLIFSLRERDYEAFKRSGLDYKHLVRQTLEKYELKHNVKLDWIANIHEKEGHPHCHVIIKGVSDTKDSNGRHTRIFFDKNDYKDMKSNFDLAFDKHVQYYTHEKLDLDKIMKDISEGFKTSTKEKEESKSFEGRYNDKVNLYKELKRIKSEVISTSVEGNKYNLYFKNFTAKEIETVRNNIQGLKLPNLNILEVQKQIKLTNKKIDELANKLEGIKLRDTELKALIPVAQKCEDALNKLEGFKIEERVESNPEYAQAKNEYDSNRKLMNEGKVSSLADIQDKIKEIETNNSIPKLQADISKEKNNLSKLEEVNKIFKASFKRTILEELKDKEFKNMNFGQLTALRVLNEYYGKNLTPEQLKELYKEIKAPYQDTVAKLKEITDNKERLNNAVDALKRLNTEMNKLKIIENRTINYGEKYEADKEKVLKNIDSIKDRLVKLNVSDKEDLKEQIISHNLKAEIVPFLKEQIHDMKPEHDFLRRVNEGMERSLTQGLMKEIGSSFEQAVKAFAKDAEKEQMKAEMSRAKDSTMHQEGKTINKRPDKDKGRSR